MQSGQNARRYAESLMGIQMRVGLHTGECEMVGAPGDVRVCGITPHIGAQVAAAASPGEILVSSTVKDLVAGSGIRFEDKGTHARRGLRRLAPLRR